MPTTEKPSADAGRGAKLSAFDPNLDNLTDEQILSLIGRGHAVLNYRKLQRGREMQALMMRIEASASREALSREKAG
jgi:hypothetical protein